MVVIRCTQKLLRRIKPLDLSDAISTTRLGDWSANLIGVRQQRFVVLVSEHSRLPVVLPARDVKQIGGPLRGMLARVLVELGVSAVTVQRELAEMRESVFCPTNSRSVLGSVNDFARAVKWRLHDESDVDFVTLALWLSETPILALGGKSPSVLTRECLQ